MSEPTPQRPELVAGLPQNTPPFQRPSTWYGLAGLATEGAALAAGCMAIPPETPLWIRNLALTIAALKFLASLFMQVSTWFVRAGVTNLDTKTEALAARTERELQKQPVSPIGDIPATERKDAP